MNATVLIWISMRTYPLVIHGKIVKAATQLMSLYWIRTHLNLHKKFVAVTFTLFKFWQVPPTNVIPIYEAEREFALIVGTTKGVVCIETAYRDLMRANIEMLL